MSRVLERRRLGAPIILTAMVVTLAVAPAPFVGASDLLSSMAVASLESCQDTVRTAALKLDMELRRVSSACLVDGIGCLVGPPGTQDGCCAADTGRCRANLDKIALAEQHFVAALQNRRCGAAARR